MRRSLLPIAFALLSTSLATSLATSFATSASAHINLTVPAPRHADPIEDQKQGPCGVAGSPRSATPTELVAGEFIEIVWNETIEHESYFRLAFLGDGDAFPDPEDFGVFCDPGVDPWCLEDGLEDGEIEGAFSFVWSVDKPPCDNCTLQLIQVMIDDDGLQADDLYYDCADIIIVEAGGGTTSSMASTTASGSGGGSGDGGGAATTGGGDGDGDGDTAAAAGGGTATSSSTAGAAPEAKTFPPAEGCQVASGDAAIGLGAPLAIAFGALAARRRRRRR